MEDFNDLLVAEIPRLRKFAAQLTKRGANMEDLVQSTLLRALEKQHLWKPETDFNAWIFCLMYRCFVTGLRNERREREALKKGAFATAAFLKNFKVNEESGQEIEMAIDLLPTSLRNVLLLHTQGLNTQQIADRLGIPNNTAHANLTKGRIIFRALLNGTHRGELRHYPTCLRMRDPNVRTYECKAILLEHRETRRKLAA